MLTLIVNPVLTVLKGTLELPWSTHVKGYIDTTKAACGKHVHLLISHSKIILVPSYVLLNFLTNDSHWTVPLE